MLVHILRPLVRKIVGKLKILHRASLPCPKEETILKTVPNLTKPNTVIYNGICCIA